MSTNDATLPERPQADVSATADVATIAPAQAVKSAALPLAADAAGHATLDAVRRDIEEMTRELEANLDQLDADDRHALAEPLGRLTLTASAAAPLTGSAPAAAGPRPLNRAPLAWAMAAIVGWIVLFAVGVSIPSAPYISLLDQMTTAQTSFLALLGAGMMVVLCSTFTNPGILSCLAAFLGGVAKRVQPESPLPGTENDGPSAAAAYMSAVVRGFFLYLVMLSGLLLLTTKAITDSTQEQYVQLAGTVSVLAFMVGYDADFFFRIMRRLDDWTQQKTSQRGGGAERKP